MRRKIGAVLAALFLALGLTACNGGEPSETAGGHSSALPKVADPQSAIEAIYKENTIERVAPADDAQMEKLGFDLEEIESYHVMYSEGSFGLADTYIIRPVPEKMDVVRELLYEIKLNRTREFERFDVLDAYNIAQNGVVYQQGDYVILLMLADNEAAQEIIDQFIPVEASVMAPSEPADDGAASGPEDAGGSSEEESAPSEEDGAESEPEEEPAEEV